jgi:hypothetical protein
LRVKQRTREPSRGAIAVVLDLMTPERPGRRSPVGSFASLQAGQGRGAGATASGNRGGARRRIT